MPLDSIVLTGPLLTRVDIYFSAVRPSYQKQVQLVFTDGKADARWETNSETIAGTTPLASVLVDDSTHRCTGVCLIDLFAILKLSARQRSQFATTPSPFSPLGMRPPPQKRSESGTRADPGAFRRQAVLAIVHELMHVLQGWQLGKNFERDYIEETESAIERTIDKARTDKDIQLLGIARMAYLENQFEAGAFDFASRWFDGHVAEINAGKFDFLLPMKVVRGMFQDFPNAF